MSRNYVFLSSGDRDLGVAFKIHLGNQASSRVEANNSTLLSSCDGYLLEPIEWPKGSQASCGVLTENSGLLSRPCRKRRPHLTMMGEPHGFSRVAARFSSYDGRLREPLMFPQESPISIRVARGSWELLSSHCRANRPHLGLCPETTCSSPVATGI